LRIVVLDEVDLPLPMPALKLLLAQDGSFHTIAHLEPDQDVDAIPGCEARNGFGSMLVKARDEIGRDTDIQRPVRLTGKNIDARLLLHHQTSPFRRPALVSEFIPLHRPLFQDETWMLKQVQHDELVHEGFDFV
jgi:hypothetical protein